MQEAVPTSQIATMREHRALQKNRTRIELELGFTALRMEYVVGLTMCQRSIFAATVQKRMDSGTRISHSPHFNRNIETGVV